MCNFGLSFNNLWFTLGTVVCCLKIDPVPLQFVLGWGGGLGGGGPGGGGGRGGGAVRMGSSGEYMVKKMARSESQNK